MPNFRKRPIVIRAEQFELSMDASWLQDKLKFDTQNNCGWIETLEGTMKVSAGDWIIRGINGEFYPCKPDIFEKTYEEAEQLNLN